MNINDSITVSSGDSLHKVILLGTDPLDGSVVEIPKELVLEKDAGADIVIVILPGADCSMSLNVRLKGEGAHANIYGLYLCGSNEKVNISVDMFHDVPHCVSRQLFKGLAGGFSKVDFYGKIIVAKDAQVTEAYQENHNLLLSDDAKVNTKPQLEIYADDVKCSHGATIGRLNEDEQFYMRSRGITLEEAKVLQMISFVSPVFEHIQNVDLQNKIINAVEDALRKLVKL